MLNQIIVLAMKITIWNFTIKKIVKFIKVQSFDQKNVTVNIYYNKTDKEIKTDNSFNI